MAALGDWTHDVARLADAFRAAQPFEHAVIDGFLSDDLARALAAEFPGTTAAPWHRYLNPIENKFGLTRFDDLPVTRRVIALLQSPEVVELLARVSGIPELEADPSLHGGGLHYHPRGGKLDMHLDYSLNPVTGKERRLNLILYLNDGWDEAWGGHLELWDAEFTGCRARVAPVFNRAAVFATSDVSYHGLPRPLTCPEGTGRKSLAVYYVSAPRPGATPRAKAEFRPLPNQAVDERLLRLYDIRRTRLLTPADLED